MHHDRARQGDYDERLITSKLAVLDGIPDADPAIPAYLLQSWARSVAFGIRNDARLLQSANFPQYVIDEQDRWLSEVVGEEIDSIWDSFGGEHWAVYCINAQALIIRARHGTNPASRAFALHVGRRIQERDIGTTAPACVLSEQRAITLIGSEHYLDEFANLFCCAVPVWGPWGSLVGVLNITGSEEFKSRLVEQKLSAAAVKIENRLFMDAHQGNRIVRIHFDESFVETQLAGLLAVNEYGDILSATRKALEMLDHIDLFNTRWQITDLFVDDLLKGGGGRVKTRLKNGIAFYLDEPMQAEQAPSSGFKGSLRAVSGQYAEQMLQEANGNVSLAARRLGVSRTTLYRALNQRVSV